MYTLADIQQEINSLNYSRMIASTYREKMIIDRKINIKNEILDIIKNKRHYIVV